MSSLAKARTGTARAARCGPAAERVSLTKILLQTVARVAMFPFPLLLAGQPSAPGTGGGKCLWLNAARILLLLYPRTPQSCAHPSNDFQRARRIRCALSNDFHRARRIRCALSSDSQRA